MNPTAELPLTALGHSHSPDGDHLLQVENLHVHYGNICALQNVSFEIGCGHCLALIGPNGAGKSTLVKTLCGLLPRIEGSATWRGRPVRETRAEIAYLPQVNELDPAFPLTVRGLAELGRYPHLGPRGCWRRLDDEVVDTALQALELEDLASRRLFQLSGGQLQRAQLARALAQEAHVLLLDEPFSGLDEPSQDRMGDLMKDLARNGRLLLVCHHDLSRVEDLFDTVLMLNREQIAFGPTQEVFHAEHLKRTFQPRAEEADHV